MRKGQRLDEFAKELLPLARQGKREDAKYLIRPLIPLTAPQ
jgi:hypothetical protein